MSKTKYVFITGGVTSSLGKGIVAASLGKLLKARGFKVAIQKLDPYINVDPGTLSPYEHGECYVTEDGAETDLDLGHYERFLSVPTSQANNVTTGKIYQTVLEKERRGDYLGRTVQVVPHVTDEIKKHIQELAKQDNSLDFLITEIGGTVGDIESLPYIEAVRQFQWEQDDKDVIFIHLTLIPRLSTTKELKTKPTQHSVRQLMGSGISPDILVCRTDYDLDDDTRKKLALFSNVKQECVIQSITADTIYDVPNLMMQEGLDTVALNLLGVSNYQEPNLSAWNSFLNRFRNPKYKVKVGLIGKYIKLLDSYKSILESLIHGGAENELSVEVVPIHSGELDPSLCAEKLKGLDGVIVAPGFGGRDIEGKVAAIRYVRENQIPFLGICFGLQMAVIEFARHELGFQDASSQEFEKKSDHLVISLMEGQKQQLNLGGTMRLGAWDCVLKEGSKVSKIYKEVPIISERHRHRYEFNIDYLDHFENKGFKATGINKETNLVEIMELEEHPFFIGVQFHPEYKSTVRNPHPLFIAFLSACLAYSNN